MKNRIFTAIAAVAILSSCEKDYSEEYGTSVLQTPINSTNILGANNCKASPYFPVCTGSQYKYSDTRGGLAVGNEVGSIDTYMLTYLGDTTIENKTYQKVKGSGGNILFYNSTNAVLTQIVLNANTQTNLTVPYYKYTIVKSNEPVGATWRDVIAIPNNINEVNDYTIIAKGLTKTVSGIVYTDVTHIRQDVSVAAYSSYMHIDQYLAKGVGLIESISYYDNNGTSSIMLHHKLISASIP